MGRLLLDFDGGGRAVPVQGFVFLGMLKDALARVLRTNSNRGEDVHGADMDDMMLLCCSR